MKNYKMTPNFSFYEMTATQHREYLARNRVLSREKLGNLYSLCASELEPIRARFGSPVIINSGYRCSPLNGAIGGSATSQHMSGQAADFYVVDNSIEEVFEWIWKESNLPFGQLIQEGVVENHPTWIHISLGEPWRSYDRSRQVMVWDAINGYERLQ